MSTFHRGPFRLRQSLLCGALAACMAAAVPAAFAQSTSATLRGRVLVDSTPAGQAQVTVTNSATGLKRTATASNGNYTLAGLPPGTYRVEVTADGQSSTETVTLAVGQTATLNLGVGGVAEAVPPGEAQDLDTVTVVAPAALVETRTSEVATYVSQKQIETLPQGSRNFLAFADIVPGVEFKTGNDGSTSLRSGAQLSNGVNVYVDGVGQKDYVLKGGLTGQDSSRGNPFPQLGIAEYKVITSNYKAEYDQLSSAAITAVTKSGTNEFQGDVFFDYANDSLRARSPQEAANGREEKFKESQYGASFSGPIVLDRLHFFLAHEVKEFNQPRYINPGRNLAREDLPPQFQPAAADTVSSPFYESLTFGKLSWTPGDAHLVELTGKFRSEDELTSVGGINTAGYGTDKRGKETRLDLRYQYSAENWLNDAHITYEDVTFGPRPATIAPGYKLQLAAESTAPDEVFPVMEDVLNLGGGRDFQEKGQKGYSFQNDFTWYGWTGHTLKAGLKFKTIDISAFQQNPYNAQYFYDMEGDLATPWRVDFGGAGAAGIDRVETDAKQYGVYVQDDWEVNDHLTLNLGVRWDYETNPAYEDHVTPAALAAALRADPGINGPNVDYDIEDYISDGSSRKAPKDNWQPRLGFSYDINADQRHVVFGGAGRAYSRNQFDYLARELYGLAFQSYTYYFDIPGHDCTGRVPTCLEFDPAYLDVATLQALAAQDPSNGTTTYLLNNDIKTPYSDQFSLGMRNAFELLGHEWNSSVTLLHVLSHDGILFTVGNRLEDGSFWEPGRTFGNPPPANLPGYGRVLVGGNGVETRLNSVLLSLDKPYTEDSGWGFTAAYTYSDAKENRNNSDTFAFDYPNLDDVPFTEALGVARHRVVVSGTVDGPWGITFSGKLTLASPVWRESLNCLDGPLVCYFEPYQADTTIGYKQLDLAAQKNWQVDGVRFWVRGDVLNAFGWDNWENFDGYRGDLASGPNENFRQRSGLGISGPTRTLKVSAGFSW